MNIRSLQNKLEHVQCFVMNNDCDILLLTETWLKESETFLYSLRNYSAVHSCRDGRGGGASIYIKDSIQFCEADHLNDHFANIGARIVNDLEDEISITRAKGMKICDEVISERAMMNFPLTNENEISEIILGLNQNSSPGSDGITYLRAALSNVNLMERLVVMFTDNEVWTMQLFIFSGIGFVSNNTCLYGTRNAYSTTKRDYVPIKATRYESQLKCCRQQLIEQLLIVRPYRLKVLSAKYWYGQSRM
ncbi:unnamed protein product [Callosobruchus maculatus]|uniref:Endonuclease/exonuclease/phosphatase domain-containing protein n=1 Tax=Callosobruchus maculatus TaxID=64391 RepID=A0A653D624_CALMS|nr:unnamed protein product [Callosobruchus maculatus]